MWGAVSNLIVLVSGEYRIVAFTDRAIVIVKASKLLPSKPKALLGRVQQGTSVTFEPGNLWGKLTIGSDLHHVHRRFRKDVEAALSITRS